MEKASQRHARPARTNESRSMENLTQNDPKSKPRKHWTLRQASLLPLAGVRVGTNRPHLATESRKASGIADNVKVFWEPREEHTRALAP